MEFRFRNLNSSSEILTKILTNITIQIPATFPLTQDTVCSVPNFAMGRNVLGVILMQLREMLLKEQINLVDLSHLHAIIKKGGPEPMEVRLSEYCKKSGLKSKYGFSEPGTVVSLGYLMHLHAKQFNNIVFYANILKRSKEIRYNVFTGYIFSQKIQLIGSKTPIDLFFVFEGKNANDRQNTITERFVKFLLIIRSRNILVLEKYIIKNDSSIYEFAGW